MCRRTWPRYTAPMGEVTLLLLVVSVCSCSPPDRSGDTDVVPPPGTYIRRGEPNFRWGNAYAHKCQGFYSQQTGSLRVLLYYEGTGLMSSMAVVSVLDLYPSLPQPAKDVAPGPGPRGNSDEIAEHLLLKNGVVMEMWLCPPDPPRTTIEALRGLSRENLTAVVEGKCLRIAYKGPVSGRNLLSNDSGTDLTFLDFDVLAERNDKKVASFMEQYSSQLKAQPMCRVFYEAGP